MRAIVKRLRGQADNVLDPGYPFFGTPELVRKAANYIERGDALLKEAHEYVHPVCYELAARIDAHLAEGA